MGFHITELNTETGKIVVEDPDFGLQFEFVEPDFEEVRIKDDYDLHIKTKHGELKILPILEK